MKSQTLQSKPVSLSPAQWPAGEYERLMAAQNVIRTSAGEATGINGAVTVSYHGLAARIGLEALRQGGSAMDAALATAITQVALTVGAATSFFGIMSLVCYDAASGKFRSMNAEWNTVRGETDPLTIPGVTGMSLEEQVRGGAPSGRTALVGGFLKGVESAHRQFGKLPFASLFEPAIYIAEQGMAVTAALAKYIELRKDDLARLPETRSIFTKADGSFYREGDILCQPVLAKTLREIAAKGASYLYTGPWAKKLVSAVRADGGRMTVQDLADYDVLWDDALTADIPGGYQLHASALPNGGSVNLIEALNIADVADLVSDGPWWTSGRSLRKALDITNLMCVGYLPDAKVEELYPNMDFSPGNRLTRTHAEALWARVQAGANPANYVPNVPRHSDDVAAVDGAGNMVAITHSINCIYWGKTAIFVDGISIGDPGAFQRMQIARVRPGERLPAPTETGIVTRHGEPVLAFASMNSGLHQRTFQCLINFTRFGMSVPEAINAPDFFLPLYDPETFTATVAVPEGRFPKQVLDATGYAWREMPTGQARLSGGEGNWVAISRDPKTGRLEAGSHNRNNSAAFAY